jgi:hypothetical protein
MWQTEHASLMALSRYDRIVVCLFRHLTRGLSPGTLPDALDFTKATFDEVMQGAVRSGIIDRVISNPPDIKYTYDARRALPAEVEQCGPMAWLQTGKGHYQLARVRRPNLITPAILESLAGPVVDVIDQTPAFLAAILGNDEQAVFTRTGHAGLIDRVLGARTEVLQSHQRTCVSHGQIEIDEVRVAKEEETILICAVSGKGGKDCLSFSQALNLNVYGAECEKEKIPHRKVRSLGLWQAPDKIIWIVEFSPSVKIDNIEILGVSRFRLTSPPGETA